MKMTNKNGLTLVEITVVIAIFSAIIAGVFLVLSTGRDSWLSTDTSIRIQENLRVAMEKVSHELRQSGKNSAGAVQVTIFNGTGINNTDVLRFSIPVVCEADADIMDANGDVAYWRAPLTWGCTSSTCMDADDSCASVEYKFIEYRIDSGNILSRQVINEDATITWRKDVIAQNITDFQCVLSGDENVVTISLTISLDSPLNRHFSLDKSMNVYLRNKN